MRSARFWVVLVLLAGTGLMLHARGSVDWVPASLPLNQLPETIGGWTGRDLAIDPASLAVLGKGSFLDRVYTPAATVGGDAVPVTLFIAYFPTQRTGQAIHSPQNCLPGSGWTFESSGVTELTGAEGSRAQVGEYVITDGRSRQEVLYWYRSHGRSIANDYEAKFYTLADSIRYHRTDAALIRVITPIIGSDGERRAHLRAAGFANRLLPLLPAYIPN
jgi:EpsI family protein